MSYIVYEQPMNEQIRLCLKLEHLFTNMQSMMRHSNPLDNRITIRFLLDLLTVSDRPDLKSKLTQILANHAASFSELTNRPNVDAKTLEQILSQIQVLLDDLHQSYAKLGSRLREDPLLKMLISHANTPGADAACSAPALALWLEQPAPLRSKKIFEWFEEFSLLRRSVKLILRITRDSQQMIDSHSDSLFFQKSLDPKLDT